MASDTLKMPAGEATSEILKFSSILETWGSFSNAYCLINIPDHTAEGQNPALTMTSYPSLRLGIRYQYFTFVERILWTIILENHRAHDAQLMSNVLTDAEPSRVSCAR